MKKQDEFYFDNFVECTHYSLKAAKLLQQIIENFDAKRLDEDVKLMHEIEHDADTKKHEMLAVLMKAFMTPIEREDIMLLSSCLDEVTDKIEDVVLKMYCNRVDRILPVANDLVKVVVDSCQEMVKLLEEFKNFKKSKTIHQSIIRINTLEEEGDRLFVDAMRSLHEHEDDILNMIRWRDVFFYLEKCTDATEHVADIVERVIMVNS